MLLVGCRELRRLEGFNALIGGDSFFAIQSSKASYPWRLAKWVEEVQYISSQMNCKFIHTLRGVNGAADIPSREESAL